jgi:hypothetical protein
MLKLQDLYIPVETIPGTGEGGIKENSGRGEFK